jgi:hypothetical protein
MALAAAAAGCRAGGRQPAAAQACALLRRFVAFALVLHSIAAQKAMRYISYVLPWMCVVWACALNGVLASGPARAERRAVTVHRDALPIVVMLMLGIGFVLSAEGTRMLNLLAGRLAAVDDLPYSEEPDWGPVVGTLAERVPGPTS